MIQSTPRILSLALFAAFAATVASPSAMAAPDGAKLFKRKCASCHDFEKHNTGPNLKGVFGRKAGSTDFPKYRALKGADFEWDEEKISDWIKDPKKFMGKPTSMAGKMKKEKDRKAVIEFLKEASK